MLQTEFEFTLPLGLVDERGNLHREGAIRLATAGDEVAPLTDARVRTNPAYLSILLLSRTVTRLGGLSPVSPKNIEALFAADFSFLQEVYVKINAPQPNSGTLDSLQLNGDASRDFDLIETECPSCGERFTVDLNEAEDGDDETEAFEDDLYDDDEFEDAVSATGK